jgi:DNA mismatch repair protein MutL
MGRIHVLTDKVANQIAAGEVVERPASVVKELLENALDAGATQIRIEVEGGGRGLIRIIDNGMGMGRDDALLAFERHATSKIQSSDDLLTIATLGFRGEALPSIASVARVHLLTRAADEEAGTEIEIAGGKLLRVEDAGAPAGTTLTVRDLFFQTPARKKFLKSEQTELGHVAQLVTHYALAHPDKHFELHTPSHALLVAPPVKDAGERIFQIFGRETLDHLLPVAAERELDRSGVPEPPPWKRGEDYAAPDPGKMRLKGYVSKPELQKLNRNSMYVFINQRLVRDRLLQHALSEAYRNVIPQTTFPVVLLFFELPPAEVDVNVHPAKTEVRFRQSSVVHDFVRDTVREALRAARPAASFLDALETRAQASSALTPTLTPEMDSGAGVVDSEPLTMSDAERWELSVKPLPPQEVRLPFASGTFAGSAAGEAVATGVVTGESISGAPAAAAKHSCGEIAELSASPGAERETGRETGRGTLYSLGTLKAVGQLRDSFILAVNEEGLWIVDQHVAHERVLFEKLLRERAVEQVQRQRMLMPVLVELMPDQLIAFAEIAAELERNGFEAEPFGARTIAIKAAPAGLDGGALERMLAEVLEQQRSAQRENLETLRARIAASIACHAAIKVNTPLDGAKMDWLLAELAKTEHPTNCPHGRPIVLRYSYKEIQRAFSRI